MKKFIIGLLSLVAPMFGIASAMTWSYVAENPTCNEDESKTMDIYMTWDVYTIYPYDAYWNSENDVLINNKTSVQIWSDGTSVSGCYGDTWALMSNYVLKGKPSNQWDRTLLLRTKNQAGCVLHKPTKIRKNATDKNVIFHYTIWFKKVDNKKDTKLNEKFYYTTPNSSQYFCVADKQRKNNVSECSKMTVGYDPEQQYHLWECLNYRIFRCGDGILDNNNEECDPEAQQWKDDHSCDPVTCEEKNPVCDSEYNWGTFETLAAWKELCNVWTVKNFQYNDNTHTWTWECEAAWTGVECSAKKPYDWGFEIKKTSISESKYITKVWQELVWEIEVTATGGDVKNVEITDKLPLVLEYVSYTSTLPSWVTIAKDQPTFSDDKKTVHWETKWTLKSWESIVLKVVTKAVAMPRTTDNYKNVACAKAEWLDEDCKDVPIWTPNLRIKKYFSDAEWNNKSKETKTVKIWDTIWYRIDFGNNGNADATITSIKDFLPKNVKYKSSKIVIGGVSIHSTGTQVWEEDIWNWHKIVDGVYIDIYGGITLQPWAQWYILIEGEILGDYQNNTTNFACIYLNDEKVECDSVVHNFETTPTPSSCFIAWTKVTMADGSQKNIEDVEIWEYVMWESWPNEVKWYDRPKLWDRKLWSINGWEYFVSDEHPFKTTDWWKAFDSVMAEKEITYAIAQGWLIKDEQTEDLLNISQLWEWDTLIRRNWKETIMSLASRTSDPNTQLYNFRLDWDNTYYANGYLVHNKWGWWGWWISYPQCEGIEIKDGVTCKSTEAKAYFRLTCDGKEYYSFDYKDGKSRAWEYTFNECKNSTSVSCAVSKNDEDWSWKTNKDCKIEQSPSWDQGCFNVNAWNFSIHEWEIFPFYWNLHNMENWVEGNKKLYVEVDDDYRKAPENFNDYNRTECEKDWQIATDAMVCTFEIYSPWDSEFGGELYTIEWPCLTNNNEGEYPLEKNNLLKARYKAMKRTYCSGSKKCYFSYNENRTNDSVLLPSAVYYIENFWSGATVSLDGTSWEWDRDLEGNKQKEKAKAYGEYKIRLASVKYLQCEGSKREQKEAGEDEGFTPCESNFVLTDPYTVQKTPSGNLTASTEKLNNYKTLDRLNVFSDYLGKISPSEYNRNDKVESAMNEFINKYRKLAVKVNDNKSNVNYAKYKVPGKNIYFVDWDAEIIWNTQVTKPFTMVVSWTATVVWNVKNNMMLLATKDIIFKWDCTSDQTVKWIFYAWGNLKREWVKKNNDTQHNYWCTDWALHVKWVLIGNGFEGLMNNSRSHLNDWFDKDSLAEKKQSVMNGASVLIEYSPSIFTKSTMPPGAEDFTTALTIYKQ